MMIRAAAAAFFLLSLLIFVIALFSNRGPTVPKRGVMHVKLAGPLVERAEISLKSFLGDPLPMTLRGVTESLRRAASDDRVVGVLFEVVDPELGLAQLQELEEAMAAFRASGKWSCAFLETAGDGDRGNAAYAAAILADKVVMAPPGDVNLVGLRAEAMFFAGLLDKLEVKAHFEQRYEYKNAANMFTERAFTAAHRESLKALVDDLQADLVRHIAARRRVDEATAWKWVRGGPFLGASALEQKLIDRLAYWDEVEKDVDELTGGPDHLFGVDTYWNDGQLHQSGPEIAVVTVAGAIVRGEAPDGVGRDDVSSEYIARGLREAREQKVKGVLLRIDSPGGSYIASDVARREVEVTRAAGIPVVVSMGSLAASGGYFIAMDGDYIVAEPATITGSIGVYAGAFAIREALAKWLGITVDAYESTPNSGAFAATEPLDERRIAVLKAGADHVYQDFIGKVAARRKKDVSAIDAIAKGRVWSGRAALERGLVDELGGMELALTRLRERANVADAKNVQLLDFPATKTPLEVVKSLFGGGARASLLSALLDNDIGREAVRVQRRLLDEEGVMMMLPLGLRIH
ncbi:MAG: S49 family peptidase [Myxococcota bacterium]|nr:S49 family peptidase [Myxococcota bacterium]